MALQMLYQHEMGGSAIERIVARFDPGVALLEGDEDLENASRRATAEGADPRALAYAERLVRGVVDHREEIDDLIREQADHWRLERMVAVDRSVLRLAVYEFLYEIDVPKLVVVDEAIELAKRFGAEQSGAFVNGLLDGLLKKHTFPGSMT